MAPSPPPPLSRLVKRLVRWSANGRKRLRCSLVMVPRHDSLSRGCITMAGSIVTIACITVMSVPFIFFVVHRSSQSLSSLSGDRYNSSRTPTHLSLRPPLPLPPLPTSPFLPPFYTSLPPPPPPPGAPLHLADVPRMLFADAAVSQLSALHMF